MVGYVFYIRIMLYQLTINAIMYFTLYNIQFEFLIQNKNYLVTTQILFNIGSSYLLYEV